MKNCIFKNLNISLTSDINSALDINLTEVLKKFFNEKIKISIKTDAETETDFKEETNLAKKLA